MKMYRKIWYFHILNSKFYSTQKFKCAIFIHVNSDIFILGKTLVLCFIYMFLMLLDIYGIWHGILR